MEQLKTMLREKFPTIDFENEKNLVSDGLLDSIAVVSIIAEIEERFGIEVTMEYITPSCYESLEAMWQMIEELR